MIRFSITFITGFLLVTSARADSDSMFIDVDNILTSFEQVKVPGWGYAIGGLLLVTLIAVFLEKRRKKKIRLAKYGSPDKHPRSARKAKKNRRKKH